MQASRHPRMGRWIEPLSGRRHHARRFGVICRWEGQRCRRLGICLSGEFAPNTGGLLCARSGFCAGHTRANETDLVPDHVGFKD